MNSLQLELDNINQQLELLTYRKTQLDSIISEYSDVVNRVKSLVSSMEDAMVEPVNLLLEIEGLIHCPDLRREPTPEELPTESTPGQPTEPAAPKFKPDDIVQHKNNELWHGRQFRVKGIQGFEVLCAWESRTGDVAYSFPADAVELVQTEPEPQAEQLPLLNLMVPIVDTSIKSQLNARAWKRNDTLLIGFTNKKLLKAWSKWFKDNWGDLIHIGDENLDGFEHCLTVLWHHKPDWERLQYLDYAVSPNEQQPQTQETSKFEYRKASETMTQVFKDGCLLGIAIDKGGCFESPQFKGQNFNSLAEVSEALWELVNKF